jgi:CubicO group peptidase (beta-lactamase class C family)
MKKLIVLFVLQCIIISPGNSQTQKYSDAFQKVTEYINKQIKQQNVTGISIAVIENDSIIWAKGFGFADKENGIEVTPNTIFPLGCVAKMFTTAAIMKLAQEGKINLDDPFIKHVPEFTMNKHFKADDPFTIRQMLAHTSGIPRVRGKNHHADSTRYFRQIIEEEKDDYLLAPPNTFTYYTDWAFILLGVLIENVTGTSFEKYMENSFFKPLNMTSSGYKDFQYVDNMSKGYKRGQIEQKVYNSSGKPSEAGYSSALDLARFTMMFVNKGKYLKKQILTEKLIKGSYEKQNNTLKFDYGSDYGLCWKLDYFSGQRQIAKWGGHPGGMSAVIRILPEHNLAVVACDNTSDFGVDKVTSIMLNEILESKGIEAPKVSKIKLKKTEYTSNRIELIKGNYTTVYGLIELTEKNNMVYTHLLDKKMKFIPCENNVYKVKTSLLGIIPVTVEYIFIEERSGRILLGEYNRYSKRKYVSGEKVNPVTIPASWKQMCGDLNVIYDKETETIDYIKLYINKGLLILEFLSPFISDESVQLVLQPISENLAIVAGLNAGEYFTSETIWLTEKDGIKRLVFCGYECILKNN